MKKFTLLTTFIIVFINVALSTTWHVGPTQTYTLPSQVKPLVADGDTINIDGGVYSNDVVKWTKKNLKFFGLGTGLNRTILQNTGDISNGKGIWVFELPGISDNAYIENIVFDGAQVSDGNGGNGAGIRYQSKDLTVINCKFINCQNGILEGNGSVTNSNVTLEENEFSNNGYAGTDNSYFGYEHNIYISASVDSLWVKNNYFHDPRGQANSIKTRAQRSWILNNYIDEAAGYGSWELNIAQGGLCIIMGNVIIQGASGANHGICNIDAATNPINEIYFINNTVINKFQGNVYFFRNFATSGITTFKFRNNVFASIQGASNTWFTGAPSVIDTLNNRYINDYNTLGFINPSAGDYNLTSSATALINQGSNAGSASNGYSLTPLFMYDIFTSPLTPRSVIGGTIDIGAYEYGASTGIEEQFENSEVAIYPNPFANQTTIAFNKEIKNSTIKVIDVVGKEVKSISFSGTQLILEKGELQSGVYFVQVISDNKVIANKKILIQQR